MKNLLFSLLITLISLSANAQNGRNFKLVLSGGMYGFNTESPYLF